MDKDHVYPSLEEKVTRAFTIFTEIKSLFGQNRPAIQREFPIMEMDVDQQKNSNYLGYCVLVDNSGTGIRHHCERVEMRVRRKTDATPSPEEKIK